MVHKANLTGNIIYCPDCGGADLCLHKIGTGYFRCCNCNSKYDYQDLIDRTNSREEAQTN